MLLPAKNATGTALTPLLRWNKIPRTTEYVLEVAEDSAFAKIILNRSAITDSSFTLLSSLLPGAKYFWRIHASNVAGDGPWSEIWNFTTSGKNETAATLPDQRMRNYPNPFSGKTTFSFSLENSSEVVLKVSDILGRKVYSKSYGIYSIGMHEIIFDGSKLRPGSYLYTIEIDGKKFYGVMKIMQ